MAAASKPSPSPQPATAGLSLPLAYGVFFLLVEPVSALVGAFYAHLRQHDYLAMTAHHADAAHAAVPLPAATSVALSQLANLYLLFALNEALVLRATADLRVWKTLLFGLLVADLGHLYALRPLGPAVYWGVRGWNAMDWGNVPFVYLGAAMRVAFLADVGLGVKHKRLVKKRKD